MATLTQAQFEQMQQIEESLPWNWENETEYEQSTETFEQQTAHIKAENYSGWQCASEYFGIHKTERSYQHFVKLYGDFC